MKAPFFKVGVAALVTICAGLGTLVARDSATPFTPKPGTALRKEICDVMRHHVRSTTGVPASRQFLFMVESMKVSGSHCGFQGFPVNTDSSHAEDLPDLVFVTFLKRTSRGWEVIADLTRTDVPGGVELARIQRTFPAEIPDAIIPDYWRRILGR